MMSQHLPGPWTSHGHDIPGVTIAGEPRPATRARCGGPGLCKQCSVEVARIRGLGVEDPLGDHKRSYDQGYLDGYIKALDDTTTVRGGFRARRWLRAYRSGEQR